MVADTSKFAYSRVRLQNNELIVLRAIEILVTATNDEIAEQLGWGIQSVTGRTNGLLKKKLIYVVDKRGTTKLGSPARRYALTEEKKLEAVSWLYDDEE